MPQDLQSSTPNARPGRPRRRRGRGGAPKKGGPPGYAGYEPAAGSGNAGAAAGGSGGDHSGGSGEGRGPEDWGANGGGGRRRRGRRGGRGSANRRGRRPPGDEPAGAPAGAPTDGAGAPNAAPSGDSFGEGLGLEPAAYERVPSRSDGENGGGREGPPATPSEGGYPETYAGRGGGFRGPKRGGGHGAHGGPPGPDAHGRSTQERHGGFFAKHGPKKQRRAPKQRGKFRGEGGGAPPVHGPLVAVTGVLEIEKNGMGFLRQHTRNFHRLPTDTFVSQQIVHRYSLRDGSFVEGKQTEPAGPGKKPLLREVDLVDGLDPREATHLPHFKRLVSVDPDFQYRLGDVPIETGMEQGDTSLRIMDMLMPLGRGQRALILSPPRGGKTILLQKIAKAIELKYPDVHLMVLLVDERPEEGTYWKRSVKGEVYVSTADESAKAHIETAEGVWRRACRLCEIGQEVVLLLDSITRLARAYNQEIGNSGRILSGGIDSRTMERPKKVFGSARNTEDGGSLTIIGTCLVDTGSRMDQVIFEEFKGTGNMEISLSRMLAEKRIFPSFDIAGSGTRKEELLLDRSELMKVSLLRRVLNKMRPMEAMELLIKKLEQYPTNRDFLEQFNLVNYQ